MDARQLAREAELRRGRGGGRLGLGRLASPQEQPTFRLARIVDDGYAGDPATSSSTTTTSTTSTSSTTTTPPACSVRVYKVIFIDAQFPLEAGVKKLTTIERSTDYDYAAASVSLNIGVGSIVGVSRSNGRYWIECNYGTCAQVDSPTTTTTTTSTTTAAP